MFSKSDVKGLLELCYLFICKNRFNFGMLIPVLYRIVVVVDKTSIELSKTYYRRCGGGSVDIFA